MPHIRNQISGGNVCSHCGSKKSPLWRRGLHSELLCNACGLYWKHHGVYRPMNKINGSADAPRSRSSEPLIPYLVSKRIDSSRSSSARSADEVLLFPKKEFMHKAALKNSMGSYQPESLQMLSVKSNGISLPNSGINSNNNSNNSSSNASISKVKLTIGNNNYANEEIKRIHPIRPNMENKKGMPKRLYPAEISSPVNGTNEHNYDVDGVKYIMLRHKMLYQRDYVAIRGSDNQMYFAVVKDFWFSSEGRKLFTLQWLLPHQDHIVAINTMSLGKILPSYFILGPDHDKPEPLEAILDIFYSPLKELGSKELSLRSEDLEIAQLLCSLA